MQQPIIVVYALWLVWFLSWIGLALLANASKRLNIAQDVFYRTMIIVGSVTLLFGFLPDPGFDVRNKLWMPLSGTPGWIVVGLIGVCFCFAWWARICQGFALAGSARKPAPFREKGPYRWMRHPIYVALIVSCIATGLAFGRPSSLAGAALIALAFLFKIIVEEGALRSEFGSFSDYAERVPMLLPLPRPGERSARAMRAAETAPAVNLLTQVMAAVEPKSALPAAPVEPAKPPAPASEAPPAAEKTTEPAPAAEAADKPAKDSPAQDERDPSVLAANEQNEPPPVIAVPAVPAPAIQLSLPLGPQEDGESASDADSVAADVHALSDAMSITKR